MSLIPCCPNVLNETVSSAFDVELGETDESIISNPLALEIKLRTTNNASKLYLDTAIVALSIFKYIETLFPTCNGLKRMI